MPKGVLKETEIKWIDPWSAGKIYAGVCAVIGFFIGLIIGIIVAMGIAGLGFLYPSMKGVGIGMGILIIILTPLVYGLIGLIAGILLAIVYNWLASKFGGVRFKS